MKKLLPLVIVLFALTAYSQQRSASTLVKINGVGLGASYAEVIKKFGKPSKDVTGEGDECIGGKLRTLTYPGLVFELHQENDDPKKFYVGNIEVTSPRWDVSGVKVGMSTAAIRRKFGKAELGRDGGDGPQSETYLSYGITEEDGPGNLNFDVRKGRVVRIRTFYIC